MSHRDHGWPGRYGSRDHFDHHHDIDADRDSQRHYDQERNRRYADERYERRGGSDREYRYDYVDDHPYPYERSYRGRDYRGTEPTRRERMGEESEHLRGREYRNNTGVSAGEGQYRGSSDYRRGYARHYNDNSGISQNYTPGRDRGERGGRGSVYDDDYRRHDRYRGQDDRPPFELGFGGRAHDLGDSTRRRREDDWFDPTREWYERPAHSDRGYTGHEDKYRRGDGRSRFGRDEMEERYRDDRRDQQRDDRTDRRPPPRSRH